MALDPTAVFMPGTGHLWVAPEGTTLPTDWGDGTGDDLDDAFDELGYTTKEGVSPKFGRETVEIEAWQSPDPIDERIKRRVTSFDVQLLEMNGVSFPFAIGGAEIEANGDGFTITPFGIEQLDRRAFVLDAIDDDVIVRFVCERIQVSGDVTTKFTREEPQTLPLTIKALAPSTQARSVLIYSNSEKFLSGLTGS